MVSYSSAVLALAASTLASSTVGALELTTETFAEMTAGKTVFLKMYAPWCGHCKAMAGDWAKLEKDFEGHDVALVASVDCTAPESDVICRDNNVQGFPTIVWGEATATESYDGGRDYESLKAFADEFVTKPVCSIYNQDPCSDEEKATIAAVSAKTDDELLAIAKKVGEEQKKLEDEFDDWVENLQMQFEVFQNEHDAKLMGLKNDNNFGIVSALLKKRGVENPFENMMDDDDDDDDDMSEGEL